MRGEPGDVPAATGAKTLTALYQWPIQTHGSIGPSCGVAEVTRESATIWTASQGTHHFRTAFAQLLGLPPEKVRVVYLEGSGCSAMNGHHAPAIQPPLLPTDPRRPLP